MDVAESYNLRSNTKCRDGEEESEFSGADSDVTSVSHANDNEHSFRHDAR